MGNLDNYERIAPVVAVVEVYIVDHRGEVVTRNHGEIVADPSDFTAALAAVAIGTKYGPSAVRENIGTGGTVLARLMEVARRCSGCQS